MEDKVFTPEQFGAVGDGRTDDTAAIQAAVDAALEAGARVKFSCGRTYLANSPVHLKEATDGSEIRG